MFLCGVQTVSPALPGNTEVSIIGQLVGSGHFSLILSSQGRASAAHYSKPSPIPACARVSHAVARRCPTIASRVGCLGGGSSFALNLAISRYKIIRGVVGQTKLLARRCCLICVLPACLEASLGASPCWLAAPALDCWERRSDTARSAPV